MPGQETQLQPDAYFPGSSFITLGTSVSFVERKPIVAWIFFSCVMITLT